MGCWRWGGALLAALLLAATGCGATVAVGETKTESRSAELGAAEAVRAAVQMGAGQLQLSGGAPTVLDARFTYNVAALRPEVAYDVSGKQGHLVVRQPSGNRG